MTDREIIQHNLKVLRKAKGLTQEELGNKLGKTKTAVASWENGTSLPPIDVVFEMCKIYGVSMDTVCPSYSAPVTTFKKIVIDYVKDKIPDNEFILMGSTDITEETKQSIDGQTTTKRITIEWLEWKGNKE